MEKLREPQGQKAGTYQPLGWGCCTSAFSKGVNVRFFDDRLKARLSSLFMLLQWSSNSCLPHQAVHIAGFGREDFGVLEIMWSVPGHPAWDIIPFIAIHPPVPSILLGLHEPWQWGQ
jgi:hypothetical protein